MAGRHAARRSRAVLAPWQYIEEAREPPQHRRIGAALFFFSFEIIDALCSCTCSHVQPLETLQQAEYVRWKTRVHDGEYVVMCAH